MIEDVERLLYHEAHLLDSGMFHEWLELMAPDLRYWAPVRAEVSRKQEAGRRSRIGCRCSTRPRRVSTFA